MYLIVEFIGEGSTGPVAKSWYTDGYSWWPPYKDLDRLLKSVRLMESPQKDKGWTKHQARILHESAPDVTMSFSQADEPQDAWSEQPPNIQDHQLETWEEHPSTTQAPVLPVSLSNENEQEDAGGEHPSNFQDDTISELRPYKTHPARTNRLYYGGRESSTHCNFRKHRQKEKAPANQTSS
ncbi:hypothetical protein QQF64_024519 [Cirrhinus molitorella]|uniref:Uncharacterized protein n=1 Tax=Cirrhinus molitorella TaxID=172907 RepID=A0ABR3NM20_9TELE